MHTSRGGSSRKVVDVSSQTRIAPTDGTAVPTRHLRHRNGRYLTPLSHPPAMCANTRGGSSTMHRRCSRCFSVHATQYGSQVQEAGLFKSQKRPQQETNG